MENRKDIIEFSISKVSTEQFAIIEEAFKEEEQTNLGTNIRVAIESASHLLAVSCQFKFEQKGIPFLKVEVSNHFHVSPESWKHFAKTVVHTVIPKDFLTHLGMITVGTARGVLHTKTEGTRFNEFILPTINVKEMIKDDATFLEESLGEPVK